MTMVGKLRIAWFTYRISRWLKRQGLGYTWERLRLLRESQYLRSTLTEIPTSALVDALRNAYWYAPVRVYCLIDSLIVHYALMIRSVSHEVCIGVHRHPFRSHAWVESKGQIINGHEHECRSFVVVSRRTFNSGTVALGEREGELRDDRGPTNNNAGAATLQD